MSGVGLEIEILEHIQAAWEEHAAECDRPPKAILFNPGMAFPSFPMDAWTRCGFDSSVA